MNTSSERRKPTEACRRMGDGKQNDFVRNVPTVIGSGRLRPPLRKNSHHSDKTHLAVLKHKHE